MKNPHWFVYVLQGSGKPVFYTGCTTDLSRRILQHNGKMEGGAKFTRQYRPWVVAKIYGPFPDRSAAQKAEYKVKRLRGPKRLQWSGL